MFNYSSRDLDVIDKTLEPILAHAKVRAAQAEQLAMDATRLMSVRPEQLEISTKQPFFKRLSQHFMGETTQNIVVSQNNLFEMQRIGWRYIQILIERDLMMAHSMITVRNNLMTLAVKETETRQMLTTMANRIADRFEILEDAFRDMKVTQEIHGWLITFDTHGYHKYPEKLRLLRIIRDCFQHKQSAWNFAELKYLQQALINAHLPWDEEITLADFIDGLIDEIEDKGFNTYDQLITLNDSNGRVEHNFILENISAPSYKLLYQIAENYGSSITMINILADQLSISKKEAMKKVLRGFIEKEGTDTTIKIPMRDLAVELLGCHGLVVRLHLPKIADVPHLPDNDSQTQNSDKTVIIDDSTNPSQNNSLTDYDNMLKKLEDSLKSVDFELADYLSKSIIRSVSGHKKIDAKEKANAIPIDVLRDLKGKWQLSSSDILSREWVKEGYSDFTAYTGFMSTTTYMQDRLSAV